MVTFSLHVHMPHEQRVRCLDMPWLAKQLGLRPLEFLRFWKCYDSQHLIRQLVVYLDVKSTNPSGPQIGSRNSNVNSVRGVNRCEHHAKKWPTENLVRTKPT